MKAQVITQTGDVSVFQEMDVPKPKVMPGTALIRVLATSVNPIDFKLRRGDFATMRPDFPAVLHGDVAGIVEEVGEGVTEVKIGDEVYGCAGGVKGANGALAEFMLVDVRLIAIKPKSLSMAEAAALPLVSITAWEALFEKISIRPGQKILIHAGAGGVGHIAIQLAKWAGAEVYATVSSPEKAALAKSFGASEVIYYRDESVEDYTNRLTDGKGFEVVFDTVGGENTNTSFAAIAPYGDVISILPHTTPDLALLFSKSANLHYVFMLVPLLWNTERERHGKMLKRIAELVDQKILKPFIDPEQFSFEHIGKAHARLESGKALGKVVVLRA